MFAVPRSRALGTPSRRAGRPFAVVTMAAVALTIAGCTSAGKPTPVSSPSTPDVKTTPDVKISADGFMPSWIDGLMIMQDGSEDAACPWATAYPVVPGADALTKAMATDVRGRVAAARGDSSGQDRFACVEPAHSTGLQIGFDFLIASADVVGVRLTSHDVSLDNRTTVQTYWYDGRAGTQSPPVSLFTDEGLSHLCDRIVRDLARRRGINRSWAEAALTPDYREDTLSDLSFDSAGAVHARFAYTQIQPVSVPPQEVIIPGADISPWLSEFGRRAQAQAVKPERRLSLAGSPTPSGSTSSRPTVPTGPVTPPEGPTVDCHAVKCIALTFDDGPGPYTARLLSDLKQYDAHATFFVIGQHVAASPGLVRAELAAGHEVGNHTWSHPQLTRLAPAQVTQQLTLTDNALRDATGQLPTLVRPPYGSVNTTVKQEIARPVILWNRDTLDWKFRNSEHVVNAVVGSAHPGDIVLMHDIHPTTVDAIPTILKSLTDQGYHFVTVSQLLGGTTLAAGKTYSDNPAVAHPTNP